MLDLCEQLAPVAAEQEALFGIDVGGLGSIREMTPRTTPADTVMLVLMGFAARQIGPRLVAGVPAG